jgi:hypothetical protein
LGARESKPYQPRQNDFQGQKNRLGGNLPLWTAPSLDKHLQKAKAVSTGSSTHGIARPESNLTHLSPTMTLF